MNNRRDFIKLAGLGSLGAGILGCSGNEKTASYALDEIRQSALKPRRQTFNMCGYAAPAIDTVRIAFIGTGSRGTGAIVRIRRIEGVDVKVVCDIQPKKAESAKKAVEGVFSPDVYTGEEDWKKVCELYRIIQKNFRVLQCGKQEYAISADTHSFLGKKGFFTFFGVGSGLFWTIPTQRVRRR